MEMSIITPMMDKTVKKPSENVQQTVLWCEASQTQK